MTGERQHEPGSSGFGEVGRPNGNNGDFNLARAAAAALGGMAAIGIEVATEFDMARAVELGFSVRTIEALRRRSVSGKEISQLIIKPNTLSHRKQTGKKLTVDESDRASRVARVLALAEKTFANEGKAARWLHKDLKSFDGRRPIDLIRTTAGNRIVEDLLGKIAWGAAA